MSWKELVGALIGKPALFVIVLGVACIALGAAGGIVYNNWFPVPSTIGRFFLEFSGAVLILFALYLLSRKT
jgi:hypothetical protein